MPGTDSSSPLRGSHFSEPSTAGQIRPCGGYAGRRTCLHGRWMKPTFRKIGRDCCCHAQGLLRKVVAVDLLRIRIIQSWFPGVLGLVGRGEWTRLSSGP